MCKEIEKMVERDLEEKHKFLDSLPEDEREEFLNDGDFWDSHCCSLYADAAGYCQICGDVVYGSLAYFHLYGGE